jgi:PKD repeat protein
MATTMSVPRWLPILLVAPLLLGVLVVPEAEAHRQGLRPGYERMLYDCSHDWGWESGRPLDRGHELVTVDITEAEVDGVPMVLIEINMVRVAPTGFGASYQMLEELEFSTPRGSFSTTIDSTSELEAHYHAGDEPAYISPRKTGMTQGGGEDEMLIAFDLGYTYDQLQIQNGEMITDFYLTAYYERFNQIIKGDVVPGGYYRTDGSKFVGCPNAPNNDPEQDETHFVAIGYEIQNSTWSVPSDEPGGEDGGQEESASSVEPVPDFLMEPEKPQTLETVRFSDSSFAPEGLQGHTWDFGDGATAEGEEVEHVYERPGRYTVRMEAQTPQGEQVSVQKLLVVLNRVPIAAFEWDPVDPIVGQAVQLVDLSEDADGRIVSWEWRIPGVGERHLSDPDVVFQQPGEHQITLIVTDDQGATGRTTETILVLPEGSVGPVELDNPGILVVLTVLLVGVVVTRRRQSILQ